MELMNGLASAAGSNAEGGGNASNGGPLPSLLYSMPWTRGLSVDQRFDCYARYLWVAPVWQDNALKARQDLLSGRKVVVALRRPTSSAVRQGKGAYDDRIAILQIAAGGRKVVMEFPANTEPSAQYDAGAGQIRFPNLAGVVLKKPDGRDINRDGVRDLGRLRPGIYRFLNNPDKSPIFLGSFGVDAKSLPTSGHRAVERDIRHTGQFDGGAAGHDKLNSSFLIHKGGAENTWSAGCQTIPQIAKPAAAFWSENPPWATFTAAMWPQRGFYYVLVDISRILC